MAKSHVSFIGDLWCDNIAIRVQGFNARTNGAAIDCAVCPIPSSVTSDEIPREGGLDGVAVSSGKRIFVGNISPHYLPGGSHSRSRGLRTSLG